MYNQYLVFPHSERLRLEDQGTLAKCERHLPRLDVDDEIEVAVSSGQGEPRHQVILVRDPNGAEASSSRGHNAATHNRHRTAATIPRVY